MWASQQIIIYRKIMRVKSSLLLRPCSEYVLCFSQWVSKSFMTSPNSFCFLLANYKVQSYFWSSISSLMLGPRILNTTLKRTIWEKNTNCLREQKRQHPGEVRSGVPHSLWAKIRFKLLPELAGEALDVTVTFEWTEAWFCCVMHRPICGVNIWKTSGRMSQQPLS